jgi:hypothetical protein
MSRFHQLPRGSAFTLLALPVVVGLVVGLLAPKPSGHWTGHLTNVAVEVGQVAAVMVALLLAGRRLDGRSRRIAALIPIGLALEIVGNWRVARSIWATPYGDDEVSAVGDQYEGFEAGHTLAGYGDLVLLVVGIAFAISLGLTHRVPGGIAVAGGALAVIPPPFVIPAVGVVFLLVYVYVFPERTGRPRLRSRSATTTP